MIGFRFCLTLVICGLVFGQQYPDPNLTNEEYLTWLYTNFRQDLWGQGSPIRQFAVVTVERLEAYPAVDAGDLPLANPDEWNAAYYRDTRPEHTEPTLFENLQNMMINHLLALGHLPRRIYLFTFNIPCPACTTFIMEYIRIHIPNFLRQYITLNPQYAAELNNITEITYHIGWNTERGNREITRATLDEFRDTNDDANDPGLAHYPRLRINPVFGCNANLNGRKKRQIFIEFYSYLTSSWTKTSGSWKHISAGDSGVWGVDTTGKVFYKRDTAISSDVMGGMWDIVNGYSMKQVAVGSKVVWAVNDNDEIYRRDGITYQTPKGSTWTKVSGLLVQISVSVKGHVWGANTHCHGYRRIGSGWQKIGENLAMISVGWTGVWAVTTSNTVCYRQGTFGDVDTSGTGWQEIASDPMKYITSGEGMLWAVKQDGSIVYRLGISTANPTGNAWITVNGGLDQISVSNRGLWGVNSNSEGFGRLASYGFDLDGSEFISGQIKHVSTGFAGVWAIDTGGNVKYRQSTYAAGSNSKGSGQWETLPGFKLKQLDVGSRVVWGVDNSGHAYTRIGITFVNQVGVFWVGLGGLTNINHITVSPAGHVWAVKTDNTIYHRVGASNRAPLGAYWQVVSGLLTQISAGQAGVWGVNVNNDVYYRQGTAGDLNTQGTSWTKVGTTKMKYVTSGPRCIRAVGVNNSVYLRSGITPTNPIGTGWTIPDNTQLQQVEIYDKYNGIWGVTPANDLIAKPF